MDFATCSSLKLFIPYQFFVTGIKLCWNRLLTKHRIAYELHRVGGWITLCGQGAFFFKSWHVVIYNCYPPSVFICSKTLIYIDSQTLRGKNSLSSLFFLLYNERDICFKENVLRESCTVIQIVSVKLNFTCEFVLV